MTSSKGVVPTLICRGIYAHQLNKYLDLLGAENMMEVKFRHIAIVILLAQLMVLRQC